MSVQRPMSPTMRSLVARLDRLIVLKSELETDLERLQEEEIETERKYLTKHSQALLDASLEAPNAVLQKAQADIAAAEEKAAWKRAKNKVQNAKKTIEQYTETMMAMKGAFDAYNRELKVEDSLNFDARQGQGGR